MQSLQCIPVSSYALCTQAMEEIVHAAHALDRRPDVKALIITGDGPKYFAAGADIKDMADQTYEEVQLFSGAKRSSGLHMLAHAITSG